MKLLKLNIILILIFVIGGINYAMNADTLAHKNNLLTTISKMKPVTSYSVSTTIEEMETIKFGTYMQTKDQYGIFNKEPVEWILVNRDEENALLMSKYILDCKIFNTEKPKYSDNIGVTYVYGSKDKASDWQHSTLRKWMNETMYNEMFNEHEKRMINVAYLDNTYIEDTMHHLVKGNWSKDNLFLLNEEETFHFFGKNDVNDNTKIKATRATDYVKRNYELRSSSGDTWYKGNSDYFLRLSGKITDYASCIKSDGTYERNLDIDREVCGVRPCIFIKLKDFVEMARIDINKEVRKDIEYGKAIELYESIKFGHMLVDGFHVVLEWYVIGREEGKTLLLCKETIKRMKFYNKNENVNGWENSEARRYLNNDFYNISFDENEKSKIVEKNLWTNNTLNSTFDSGSWTLDRIFLLSYDEILNYIGAENRNILIGKNHEGETTAWYLRTMGDKNLKVSNVKPDGGIDIKGYPVTASRYIRPAMWIYE